MILHKVSTSPFKDNALVQCLSLMAADDGLLLLQDAVYAAHGEQQWSNELANVKHFYILDEDMQARGIVIGQLKAKVVNYAEFVELCLHYDKVVSW
jgi:tRNA 2-thiouridine synthesizing protein B